jgi:hypothetical protein
MMRMMVVVVAMMVPMMRRIRKTSTRKQTQRYRDSDELGHISDSNLRDSEFFQQPLAYRQAEPAASPRSVPGLRSMRVFQATDNN